MLTGLEGQSECKMSPSRLPASPALTRCSQPTLLPSIAPYRDQQLSTRRFPPIWGNLAITGLKLRTEEGKKLDRVLR